MAALSLNYADPPTVLLRAVAMFGFGCLALLLRRFALWFTGHGRIWSGMIKLGRNSLRNACFGKWSEDQIERYDEEWTYGGTLHRAMRFGRRCLFLPFALLFAANGVVATLLAAYQLVRWQP